MTGRLFYPGTPVSTINQTYHHDIAEILLKVALKTKTLIHIQLISCSSLFVLWSFFFWPFYCLSCFDWRLIPLWYLLTFIPIFFCFDVLSSSFFLKNKTRQLFPLFLDNLAVSNSFRIATKYGRKIYERLGSAPVYQARIITKDSVLRLFIKLMHSPKV